MIFLISGDIDYHRNFTDLETLCKSIEQDAYTSSGSVDCWITAYKDWLTTSGNLGQAMNSRSISKSPTYILYTRTFSLGGNFH